MNELNNMTVSASDLAFLTGLSNQRIFQLVKDGVIVKNGRSNYQLAPSIQAYCEYVRGVSRGSVSSQDEKQERTRYMSAKASLAELDHEERQGNLRRGDVIDSQDYAIATILKNNLQSIPDRQSAILAAETDPAKVHDILSVEVRNSLNDAIQAMAIKQVDDAHLDITRRNAREELNQIEVDHEENDDEHHNQFFID